MFAHNDALRRHAEARHPMSRKKDVPTQMRRNEYYAGFGINQVQIIMLMPDRVKKPTGSSPEQVR